MGLLTLSFENGYPNESLSIGDMAYYINPNYNFENIGLATADESIETTNFSGEYYTAGVSNLTFIVIITGFEVDNSPDQFSTIQELKSINNSFKIYVQPLSGELGVSDPQPPPNSFIFFVKKIKSSYTCRRFIII